MEINTKFSNGDVVHTVVSSISGLWSVYGPFTIGRVSVEATDSPGIEGEEMFDNYKEQKGYKESYMFIETGVGSGTIHDVNRMFKSFEDATEEAGILNSFAA